MVGIGKELQEAFDDGYKSGVKKANEWISVNDRLPEDNQEVIAVVCAFYGGLKKRTEVVATHYTEKNGFDFFMIRQDSYLVTHWMPLPEPPKGEEK